MQRSVSREYELGRRRSREKVQMCARWPIYRSVKPSRLVADDLSEQILAIRLTMVMLFDLELYQS